MIYYHIIIRFLEFRSSNQGNRVYVYVCVYVYTVFLYSFYGCARVRVLRELAARV